MLSQPEIGDIATELKLSGYVDLGVRKDLDILSLGRQLGTPVPVLPGEPELGLVGARSEAGELSPNEYAAVYGGANIPLHTDAAYYRVPPRLGILRLKPTSVSDRPTILVNPLSSKPDHREFAALRRSLWRIYGGGSLTPFAGRIVEAKGDDYWFRFDHNCMRPYFRRGKAIEALFHNLLERCTRHEIAWQPGQIVVWDNWKLLHGNGSVKQGTQGKRILERVLINAALT